MKWTKKHQAYCLEKQLPPSAIHLWQWLISSHEREGHYSEPDLREFNQWVAKRRPKGGYCAKTLKNAIAHLADCGILQICKTFLWHTHRILLRTIDYLIPPRSRPGKKLPNRDQNLNSQPSNGEISSEWVSAAAATDLVAKSTNSETRELTNATTSSGQIKQVASPEVLCECAKTGLPFTDSEKIAPFSLYEVRRSLLKYIKRVTVDDYWPKNPQGWLIRCLENQWWNEPEGAYDPPDYTNEQLDVLLETGRQMLLQMHLIPTPVP